METTTVEDSEDQENLKALKNSQMCMTQEGYPYGTWQTMEAVNTREQGVSEKDRNMEHKNPKFCMKTLRQEISTMERQLMEMTRAETRLSMMLSPAYAIFIVLS